MKKIFLMILSLITVSLLLIGCTPTDEAGSEGLSDEELEAAARDEGEKAVAGQATYTLKPITWLSCSDSDGGINSETAGLVSGAYSQSGKKYFYKYEDVCKENTLKEYSCSGSKFVVSSVECKNGCKDGACVPAAQKQICGNGVKEGLEQCDDGNTGDGDGCTNCVTDYCGDGDTNYDIQLNAMDGCDDDNNVNGDGCSANCLQETGWSCAGEPSLCNVVPCGDGIVDETEQCDDGNKLTEACSSYGQSCQNICDATCKLVSVQGPFCGDGNINSGNGEQCDDANKVSGDGCDLSCKTEVADLVIDKLSYNIDVNPTNSTMKTAVVNVTLKNIGTAGTGTWFNTLFSFNPASAGFANFGKQISSNVLAAGAQVSGTYQYMCYGSHILNATVDYSQTDANTNKIAESNENNNMKTIDVDC